MLDNFRIALAIRCPTRTIVRPIRSGQLSESDRFAHPMKSRWPIVKRIDKMEPISALANRNVSRQGIGNNPALLSSAVISFIAGCQFSGDRKAEVSIV
jgi:hypothetical protein